MAKKVALITGITGQDGSFLAEYLLDLGYEVWGVVRRASRVDNINRIKEITRERANLRYGDMTDATSLRRILKECRPDEIYNLAAQSHVRISFDMPEYTTQVNAVGVINLLQAAQDIVPSARFYQASTSEMFGTFPPPQNEETPFHPRSPYGEAKVAAFWAVVNHREGMNMFASNGILFNHESERRGDNFVTRKITMAAAKIVRGHQQVLKLGNLDAKRDWGYAGDYVKAMHLILQHDSPDDFVIATGETHTVRDFLLEAFHYAGMPLILCAGAEVGGLDEKYEDESGILRVAIDERFFRPTEVHVLQGDASKAKDALGWEPQVKFAGLVQKMVDHDLKLVRNYGTSASVYD